MGSILHYSHQLPELAYEVVGDGSPPGFLVNATDFFSRSGVVDRETPGLDVAVHQWKARVMSQTLILVTALIRAIS